MKISVKGKEYELDDLSIKSYSSEERELTVNVVAGDDYVKYYTSMNKYFTKIKKNIATNPEQWKITNLFFRPDGTLSGVEAHGPLKSLSLRSALRKEKNDSSEDSEE